MSKLINAELFDDYLDIREQDHSYSGCTFSFIGGMITAALMCDAITSEEFGRLMYRNKQIYDNYVVNSRGGDDE